jgi:hypothetical protein
MVWVAVAVAPAASVTVATTFVTPTAEGIQERVGVLELTQPLGRGEYE